MKEFRFLLFIVITAFLIGCGSEEPKQTEDQVQVQEPVDTTAMTEEDKIKAAMTELIERVMEGDKTALYENEFSYYKDETSLSDYMKLHRVIDYSYDTLGGITFNSVNILGDFAVVDANIIYNSKAGGSFTKSYEFKMYNFDGKWIKPYMSNIRLERDYREQRRIYDSTVAANEAGK